MTNVEATIIGSIIGGVIGVIGSVTGFILSRKSAIDIVRRQEFNHAAAEFTSAFVEARRRLDENKNFDIINPDGIRVHDILKKFIVEHERAKIIFSAYLPTNERSCFNNAWEEYYSQENRNAECLSEYKSIQHETARGIDLKHEMKIRELALSRIEKLLGFAGIN